MRFCNILKDNFHLPSLWTYTHYWVAPEYTPNTYYYAIPAKWENGFGVQLRPLVLCVYKHKCTCVEMVTYKILQKAHGKVEFKNKPIFPSPKLNPCCFFMMKKISCMNGLKTSCLNPFSIKPVWELAFWRAWQQQACGFLNVLAALMNHNSQSLWSHWGTSCRVIVSQIIMSTEADGSGGPHC